MRLKTAVLTAVLAGSLAGPSVLDASAANHARSVTATRAIGSSLKAAGIRGQDAPAIRNALSKLGSVAADDPAPGPDPIGVVDSVISEIQFVLSGQNIQAILWDLPGFGPY
jgi:hypothetical protein